jgi:hypothetical protein
MAGRISLAVASRMSERLAALRKVSFAAAMMFMAACGDSVAPPAPEVLDPVAADQLLPAVIDARVRLAPSIENQVVRDRVTFDLQKLEDALRGRDAQASRFHVRVVGNVITEYMSGRSLSLKEGPDVTGIALTLHQVSLLVRAGFQFSVFP